MKKIDNIIFFDGICNLCNGFINFVWSKNSNRNFYYSSLQSKFSSKFLSEKGLTSNKIKTIYFYDGNNLYDKSTAVIKILNNLDGFFPIIAKIFSIFPRFLRDAIYNLIAKYRYKIFGKSEVCRLPSKEEKSYFLDE